MKIRSEIKESGQALVEFALVMPVLLLFVFGIIQFGLIFNGKITVTSAAREGARLAVVGADETAVKERVKDTAVALLLDVPDGGIIVTGDAEKISVKVNGTVDIIVPIFTGDSYAVSSESIMRIEVAAP